TVAIGRFCPFVRRGSTYASPAMTDDPYEITLERALDLARLKEEAAANRRRASFDGGRIQLLRGRLGPYVTDGEMTASLPRNAEPGDYEQAAAEALLAEKGKPARRRGAAAKKPAAGKTATKKTATKKAATKKAATKKAATKKAATKKATTRKATTRRTAKADAPDAGGGTPAKKAARKTAAVGKTPA